MTDTLIERYLDVLVVEYHIGAATRAAHRLDLLNLERWLGRHSKSSLVDVTDTALVRYLSKELARSPTLAVRRRRTMRRFYAWLKDVGCRDDDPMQGRRMRNWWTTRAKIHIPPRQARRLELALTSRNQMIVALMLSCGLEARDIAALKLRDLVLNERVLLSQNRRIELRPVLLKMLQQYLDNARPRLLRVHDSEYVFLSPVGSPLYPAMLRDTVASLTGKFWRSRKREERSAIH
ncbi:hypothetical protein ACG33_07530 [Steroidobacter denitrificans]|uniref:Integrase n=1 Tax=Steroidobacter denitrificans TaxID=465721 RepID=A0A127FBM2_STEDE|nr:site-specific integrase [Steroidobacter denitrificans]AMN46949.1 hypothetical protein ACG33_07530 [Steroidobacter denitrificans]